MFRVQASGSGACFVHGASKILGVLFQTIRFVLTSLEDHRPQALGVGATKPCHRGGAYSSDVFHMCLTRVSSCRASRVHISLYSIVFLIVSQTSETSGLIPGFR